MACTGMVVGTPEHPWKTVIGWNPLNQLKIRKLGPLVFVEQLLLLLIPCSLGRGREKMYWSLKTNDVNSRGSEAWPRAQYLLDTKAKACGKTKCTWKASCEQGRPILFCPTNYLLICIWEEKVFYENTYTAYAQAGLQSHSSQDPEVYRWKFLSFCY